MDRYYSVEALSIDSAGDQVREDLGGFQTLTQAKRHMREHTDTDVFHVTLHVRRGINADGGSLYRSTRSTWERDHGRLVRL